MFVFFFFCANGRRLFIRSIFRLTASWFWWVPPHAGRLGYRASCSSIALDTLPVALFLLGHAMNSISLAPLAVVPKQVSGQQATTPGFMRYGLSASLLLFTATAAVKSEVRRGGDKAMNKHER